MNWGKILKFVGTELIKSLTRVLLGELEKRPDNKIDMKVVKEFEDKAFENLNEYKK